MLKRIRRSNFERRQRQREPYLRYEALEARVMLSATEGIVDRIWSDSNDAVQEQVDVVPTKTKAFDEATTAGQFNGNSTRRIEGTITGASGATHPVAIERFDSPNLPIDADKVSWIIVHGFNSAPDSETIDPLVRAVTNSPEQFQVLTLDWSSAAATTLSLAEENIIPVATWAATALSSYGFVGQSLNFVGHSFGTYVTAEMAQRTNGGVNALVALDPAANVPGNSYDPNATVSFVAHTEMSTTLYSRDGFLGGISGNSVTSVTSTESVVVTRSGHSEVVDVFTNMIKRQGNCEVYSQFSLSRIIDGTVGPWVLDQFDGGGQFLPGAKFEAVIAADTSGEIAQSIEYIPRGADLGTVDFVEFSSANDSCERWYQGTTSQEGYFTAEAFFVHANGDIDLEIYNTQLQLVAGSYDNTDSERVEIDDAAEGETYYVRVLGANPHVDYRVVNLVARDGNQLDINGTSDADSFVFAAHFNRIMVNGVMYEFAPGELSMIRFDGGGGADSINLNGSAVDDTAMLRAGDVLLSGGSYAATAINIENVTVRGNSGADVVTLYDTAGEDILRGYHDRMVMVSNGFLNRAAGFETNRAYASDAFDRAFVFDSDSDDQYRTYANRVVMSGDGYLNWATGFDRAFGFSSTGDDMALMFDSVGNDTYRTYDDRVVMSGNGYFNSATGFGRTFGYSSGGHDMALMFDSPTADTLRAYDDHVVMTGDSYFNSAIGFARTFGFASGRDDRAWMFDSSGDDLFRTYHDRVVMSGDGYFNWAGGFETNKGYASSGNDSARMYDSTGDDSVTAESWGAYLLLSQGSIIESRGFDQITALSINGGQDTADDNHIGYTFNLVGPWL